MLINFVARWLFCFVLLFLIQLIILELSVRRNSFVENIEYKMWRHTVKKLKKDIKYKELELEKAKYELNEIKDFKDFYKQKNI